MTVMQMWNLDEDAVKALPETGMGFQFVEGSLMWLNKSAPQGFW